jgi:hypothetical protein
MKFRHSGDIPDCTFPGFFLLELLHNGLCVVILLSNHHHEFLVELVDVISGYHKFPDDAGNFNIEFGIEELVQ